MTQRKTAIAVPRIRAAEEEDDDGDRRQPEKDPGENHAEAAFAGPWAVLSALSQVLLTAVCDLDHTLSGRHKSDARSRRAHSWWLGDNLAPYFNAGRSLTDAGNDLPRAERYFRKYLTQEPELNQPKWSRAHWSLGLVLEKEGRKSDAVAELKLSTSMEPTFEPAAKDLKRLQ